MENNSLSDERSSSAKAALLSGVVAATFLLAAIGGVAAYAKLSSGKSVAVSSAVPAAVRLPETPLKDRLQEVVITDIEKEIGAKRADGFVVCKFYLTQKKPSFFWNGKDWTGTEGEAIRYASAELAKAETARVPPPDPAYEAMVVVDTASLK